MDFKGIEEAILGRLKSEAADFPSRIFPNNPKTAGMMSVADGEYLLRYEGSRYALAVPLKDGGMKQDRTSIWAVTARNRCLTPDRNNPGVYTMLEASRVALVGWTVPGVPDATKMQVVQDGFTEEVEGIWEYTTLFSFTFQEVKA